MKTTRLVKYAALGMLTVGITTAAHAQYTPAGPAPHVSAPSASTKTVQQAQGSAAANEAKQLQTALKLTDAQTTRVTTTLEQIGKEEANDKAAQANIKNWQATRNIKAMIDYMVKQMDTNATRIGKIFTPDQNKTFQEMIKKRRDALLKMEASQK